ncbi:MAG TPA: S8 family serine peptidase [Anaerolineales bacterium]|nr:S8 family serine peptidase [Anaerolineales bacterium]
MPNIYRTIVTIALTMLAVSCTTSATVVSTLSPLPEARIIRQPKPMNGGREDLTSIPKFDPNLGDGQVDLRSRDLTKIDITDALADLLYADFDSKTQWPSADKMPAGFDWQKIMELGKDPGLGVRALHSQGITGRGIGVAIIDQTLLVDHVEYKDRIQVYEEAEDVKDEASMHGPAVASIAAGKSVGVAPEADLYYIATGPCGAVSEEDYDLSCNAKAIQRIVEINKSLPADRKIRVLSMSNGWMSNTKGHAEIMAAVEEAKAAGIFVITVSLEETHGWNNLGLGRNSLSDPNDFQSYEPTPWLKQYFFEGKLPTDILYVPMDSRTTASPTGKEDYVFYRQGGMSWAVPYLAGIYALAAQVKPDITPEEFWETALKTGKTIQLQHDGKEYEFGVILDPQALIDELQSR